MPLKTAVSRTCDRPTKARSPAKSSPRVKPGSSATGSYRPVFGSTTPSVPAPDSQTHSRPAYQRGECGIDRPRAIDLAARPRPSGRRRLALFARQPAGASVSPRAVT